MKNVIIIVLLIVLVLLVFGVIEYYDLINWRWENLAIAAAALAGPFQYVKSKLDEQSLEKEEREREHEFKTMEYEQFKLRQQATQEHIQQLEERKEEKKETESPFDVEEPTFG